MPYNRIRMGMLIREWRREKGLSQEVLSGCAGIARSHLAYIENGDVTPTADTLWRICDALGIRVSTLFEQLENEPDAKG